MIDMQYDFEFHQVPKFTTRMDIAVRLFFIGLMMGDFYLLRNYRAAIAIAKEDEQ